MCLLLQKKKIRHSKIVLLMSTIVMSAVSLFIYVYDNDEIETFIYIAALIVLLYTFYNEKIWRLLIVAIWIFFVLSMIDTMGTVLFDIFMDLCNINGEIVSNLVVSTISLILIYIVGRIYEKNSTVGMAAVGIVKLAGFTFLVAIDSLVVTIIAVMNKELTLKQFKNMYLIAVIFLITGIFIQLVAVILLFMQRNVYKEKKLLTEKYLEEQKNHYEYLEKREQETKKFRHDFRSHLEMISFLAKNHEYDKIDSYLEQMNIRIDELGNNVTVQNGTVDAILNQYYARAMQQGIHMEVKGRLPGDCEIDAYDLCTIFSNVLSNAMEACVDTEEKYMSVECGYNERNIIIVAKNSFDGEGKKEGTWLKSRKENVNYHGFGLENMKDSINKYHGLHEITAENNIFTLTIIFNNMRKNEYESINSR